MLTANLFSQFTSDPSQVARMVNMMSALLSAATILFLFWTISHLVRRLLIRDWSEPDPLEDDCHRGLCHGRCVDIYLQ